MRAITVIVFTLLWSSATSRAGEPQTLPDCRIPIRSPGDPPITLPAAAGNSGLPLTWSVAAGPVTVSGNTVTLTGAYGGVTLRATQTGNAQWDPLERFVTFPVTEDGGFREVSGFMGSSHGLDGIKAITRHGMLMAWQDTLNQPERRRVRPDIRWKTVSAGYHTVAISEDGSLWAWGSGWEGELGAGADFIFSASPQRIGTDKDWGKVATMSRSSFALKTDGTLWRWGELTPTSLFTPKMVDAGTDWRDIEGSQWSSVSLLRRENGTLAHFYDNFGTAPGPSPLYGNPGAGWARISGSFARTLGIKTDGTLWTITLETKPLNAGTEWKEVSTGRNHYLALRADGSLWGDESSDTFRLAPRRIAPDIKWEKIFAGHSTSALLDADGGLWVLGYSNKARPAAGETVTQVNISAGGSYPVPLYRVAPDYFPQSLSFLENRERTVPVLVGSTIRAGARECSSGMPPEITIVSGPATLTGDVITFTAEGPVEVTFTRPRDNTWSALDERVTFLAGPPRPELSVHDGPTAESPPLVPNTTPIRLSNRPRAVALEGESRAITLLNTGTEPLLLTGVTSEPASGMSFTTAPVTAAAIAPGDSLRLDLTLRAREYGYHTLTVLLHTNDEDEPAFPVMFSVFVVNTPPVASAGPDRTVPAGRTIRLDAEFFTDDAEKATDPLEYMWDLDGGGFTREGAEQFVTLTKPGQTLTARLRVRDADGGESIAACVLTACPTDMIPPAAILRKSANDIQLVFPGEPGGRYNVQFSSDMKAWGNQQPRRPDGEWLTCGEDGFFAVRTDGSYDSRRGFFRARRLE